MLYDDFIKELAGWQGIFDGYIENPVAYKEYFRLISENVKDLETLRFCLESHANDKNRFFPKPFELNDYANEFKKITSKKLHDTPFYKEILEMKSLFSIQKNYLLQNETTIDPEEMVQVEKMKKIIIETEKQIKDLEEKRSNLLKKKGYLNG
jgi:hypothetical protein